LGVPFLFEAVKGLVEVAGFLVRKRPIMPSIY